MTVGAFLLCIELLCISSIFFQVIFFKSMWLKAFIEVRIISKNKALFLRVILLLFIGLSISVTAIYSLILIMGFLLRNRFS